MSEEESSKSVNGENSPIASKELDFIPLKMKDSPKILDSDDDMTDDDKKEGENSLSASKELEFIPLKKNKSPKTLDSDDDMSDNDKNDTGRFKCRRNRILKRKKKKYDWEEIIVNEDYQPSLNEGDKRVFKLTVSNFPTHWSLEEIKKLILSLHAPVDVFYTLIDKKQCFVGSIQLHFENKEQWKEAWNQFNGKRADEQRIFAHVNDKDSDSESDTNNEEPPLKKPKGTSEAEEKTNTIIDVWETDEKGLYGLKQEYLESLGIQPPINKWIHVENVRCDKSELKEVFSIAGEVVVCNIFYAEKGRSANIMYSHPLEAVQAVSMFNNQELFGAVLQVTMNPNHHNTQSLPKGLKSVGPGFGNMNTFLRDVVRQYERYLKGLKSSVNKSLFVDKDETNFCIKNVCERPYMSNPSPYTNPRPNFQPFPTPRMPIHPNMPSMSMGQIPGPMGPNMQGFPGPVGQFHPGHNGPVGPVLMNNRPVINRQLVDVPMRANPGPRPGPMNSGPMPMNSGPMHMNSGSMPMNAGPMPSGPMNSGPRPSGPLPPAPVPPSNMLPGPVPVPPGTGPLVPLRQNLPSPSGSSSSDEKMKDGLTVKLFNLPLSTTFPLLCERMAECGAVTSLQLGGPGEATVHFAERAHAMRCMQMYNKRVIMGNTIEVRLL